MTQSPTPQQQILLDRQTQPHHAGSISQPDFQTTAHNPLCGDQLTITATIQDGHLQDLKWQGQGCIISQAGTDLQIDTLLGQSLTGLQNLAEDDFINLLPIDIRPSRRKCALLLRQCLRQINK